MKSERGEKKTSLLVELLMRLQSKHVPYVWGFNKQEGVSLPGCLLDNAPVITTCCSSGETHPETSFAGKPSNQDVTKQNQSQAEQKKKQIFEKLTEVCFH